MDVCANLPSEKNRKADWNLISGHVNFAGVALREAPRHLVIGRRMSDEACKFIVIVSLINRQTSACQKDRLLST